MHTRDDIKGTYRAPKSVEKFLLKFGGKTPHGEPHYRLVHTSSRYMKFGGVWNEWPDGINIQDRGGLTLTDAGLVVPGDCKPIRQVAEVREFLMYGHIEGRWLVERWQPAHMYGSREAWERMTVPGHPELPMLGPYPEFGEYMMCSEPTVIIPSESQLERVIQQCEFLRNDHHASVEQAVIEHYNEGVEKYEREQQAVGERLRLQMLDAMIPDNRVSLSAGRHREHLARLAGVKEHCGN